MTAINKSANFVILIVFILAAASPVASALTEPPSQDSPESLSLIVLKMTGEEYVMLKNNSPAAITDLSQFSLKAYNNYNPETSNVSVSTQTLPAVSLGQSETLLLSSTIRPTCGADLAGRLSISMIDGSGRIEIVKVSGSAVGNVPEIVDSVSWSSTSSGDIKSVPTNTKVPLAVYYRFASRDTFSWQFAELDLFTPCQLNVTVPGSSEKTSVIVTPEDNQIDTVITIEPVVVAEPVPDTETQVSSLPIQITELLPNPLGTGNDTTDEFIELYNPNDQEFDLTGYQLQTGTSRLYNFTFKPDTTIQAKTYQVFYSSVTGLTLSNTSGQARLLSTTSQSVSATDVYRTAKDGVSWSLVDDVWSWSEVTTPNALNVLQAPKVTDKKSIPTKSSLTKKTPREPAVKKPKVAKAPKAPKPKKIKVEKTTKYSTVPDTKTLMERPVQTKLVATVGSVAVLYGAYEYRSSLANGFYKLRRKLGFSRTDRGQP